MSSRNSAFLLPLMAMAWLWHLSNPSSAITNNFLNGMCDETLNPGFCKTTLGKQSRIKKANVQELAVISILLATAQARLNEHLVKELFNNEKDEVSKSHLSDCLSDYNVTLGKLKIAYRLSDKMDYKGMQKQVNDALKMSKKCEYRFTKEPPRPSPLTDYNNKMVWLNDIARVILNYLND
ncbi:pectinesterase inhibitor 1-like [Herrania umbratica]|uniref:Pectinesterase inhibitor 1-like n=1 Tax=Herrania umbratica TaxID=108875 RepID=A0A6J1AV80_9ROSI|nr:pectinesterase inhibitor 1-like [Herrania umbratica]